MPETYAAALRLRDAGLNELEMARRLELDIEAVHTLVALAEAKLASLMREDNESPARGD